MTEQELRQKVEESNNGFYVHDIRLLLELVKRAQDNFQLYRHKEQKHLAELRRKLERLDAMLGKPEPTVAQSGQAQEQDEYPHRDGVGDSEC